MAKKLLKNYTGEELFHAMESAIEDGSEDTKTEILRELCRRERQRERQKLGDDANKVRLEEFVKWVEKRDGLKALGIDAPIDGDVLKYVAQGVSQYLNGNTPWPKKRGNKIKRDLTWECYWLTNFYKTSALRLPQHKEKGGAFSVVGEKLNLTPEAVETHVRNARKLIKNAEGKRDFELWLSDYEYDGGRVVLSV